MAGGVSLLGAWRMTLLAELACLESISVNGIGPVRAWSNRASTIRMGKRHPVPVYILPASQA